MAQKLSDALNTSNPVQDSSAGDDPMSMGTKAVQYALFTVVALAGVTAGVAAFGRLKTLLGADTADVPGLGDLN